MDTVNSTPSSEEAQQKDHEPKFPAWANIILIPGLATAFAFLVSWSFVFEYSFKSGLPIELYFDVIDYVQLTPRWAYIFIPLCAILVGSIAWLNILYFQHPAFASVVAKAVRPRAGKIMAFVVAPMLAFLFLIMLAFRMGSFEARNRKYVTDSAIFRKGENTPLKGKLLFQLSRYVLILADNKDLIAIPQTEVQMIQTPWRPLQSGGTSPPISASPATTVTPSSTASTSPTPK
jgi:hypothetical protein